MKINSCFPIFLSRRLLPHNRSWLVLHFPFPSAHAVWRKRRIYNDGTHFPGKEKTEQKSMLARMSRGKNTWHLRRTRIFSCSGGSRTGRDLFWNRLRRRRRAQDGGGLQTSCYFTDHNLYNIKGTLLRMGVAANFLFSSRLTSSRILFSFSFCRWKKFVAVVSRLAITHGLVFYFFLRSRVKKRRKTRKRVFFFFFFQKCYVTEDKIATATTTRSERSIVSCEWSCSSL